MEKKREEVVDVDEEEEDASGAGALRSALRAILRRASKTAVGAIPLQNPKLLARKADKISEWIDHAMHISSENNNLSNQTELKTSRFKRLASSVFYVLPSIAKSSVLGGILFSSYDFCNENLTTRFQSSSTITIIGIDASYLLPMVAGAMGGAAHGISSVTWDKVAIFAFPKYFSRRERTLSVSLSGTVFAHSFVHMTLFGSFHIMKELFLKEAQRHQNKKTSSPSVDIISQSKSHMVMNFFAVSLAGGIAGSLAELAGYYLSPLEKGKGFKYVLKLPKPTLVSILFASIPSSIGFLASHLGSQ